MTFAVVLGIAASTLVGCASVSESRCEGAFGALSSLEESPGLDLIVTYELRDTLDECDSVDSWITTLAANPRVVGLEVVSEADSIEYLGAVCAFTVELGLENDICDEARDDGLIL